MLTAMLRCAVYARFSSDLQRDTSLDDQITVARRYAEGRGWAVLDQFVFYDTAISGVSLDRPGIQSLLSVASATPPPFDVLLVDDSSRVARDLPDAIRFLQELKFRGVRVIYVSQQIDSASEQAETLAAIHGIVDSLYLREMAKKIKRGLAGQLDRGFATGSITFGYRTVPVLDPSGKTDVNGHQLLLGKRVEIVPTEAETVRRIFEWYADGIGIGRIVDRLRREGCAGPRGGRWREGAVKRIVANERYRGLLIWGRDTSERRPGTRSFVRRQLPRSEWKTKEQPGLRIVSDELWGRVRARREEVRRRLPTSTKHTLMRGKDAALHSPHLFSGFLKCGACGGAVVITTGGHGSPRYGCLNAQRNGQTACTNRLTMRAKVADQLLVERLQQRLLEPATVAYITGALSAALNDDGGSREQQLAQTNDARSETAARLDRLIRAIELGAPPAALNPKIVALQADIARLDERLQELAESPEQVARRLAVMPSVVREELSDLAALLVTTPERAKQEFRRLGLRVDMVPVSDEQPRPFYRATMTAALLELEGVRDLSGATSKDRLLPQIHQPFAGSAEEFQHPPATGRLNLRAVP